MLFVIGLITGDTKTQFGSQLYSAIDGDPIESITRRQNTRAVDRAIFEIDTNVTSDAPELANVSKGSPDHQGLLELIIQGINGPFHTNLAANDCRD